MTIHLRLPTAEELRPAAEQAHDQELTYRPVGTSFGDDGAAPPGFRRQRWYRELGRGDEAFGRAAAALRGWQVHRGAGLVVLAGGPPAEGTVVAMAAPLPVGAIEAVCRVVAVWDEPGHVGFAYGTLPNHPERGEERFTVRHVDGVVRAEIVAVARPRHPLARLAPPVARRLQRRATDRYLDAWQRAVGVGPAPSAPPGAAEG